MNRRLLIAVSATASLAFAGLATAQQPSRADSAVKYRQAMYQVMYNNFAPVAGMATGRVPYDAKMAQKRAERASYLAQMISDGFPPESAEGKPTKAKVELWANRADFDKLMVDWQKTMVNLSAAAKTGKADKLKPAFEAAAAACKACHDKYRIE
jgi:cytochrome c556